MRTTRVAGECDLCGQHADNRRFDASEFDLEGWICGTCVSDLQDEQAEVEHKAIFAEWANTSRGRANEASELLVILSPAVRWADLTNQGVARLEQAAAERRARRQPKVVVPIPPATPCVTCKTTAGKLDSPRVKHVRLEGARLGAPGLHCGACYARLWRRLTNLRSRVALAS